VRKITPDGIISRFAGTGTSGFADDDGPALDAQVVVGGDIEVGPNGNVYFTDGIGSAR